MRKIHGFASFIVIGLLAPVIFGQVGQSRINGSVSDILERKVVVNDPGSLTMPDAFLRSLVATRVPGGRVRMLGCESQEAQQEIARLNSTLREVLDSIVSANRLFTWRAENGVINLIPTTGLPPLLETRVNEFRMDKVASTQSALSALLALPEVKNRIAELRLSEGLNLMVVPTASVPDQHRFDVHCKDVTLRDALNAIARAQGRAVWSYTERQCNGKNVYSIDFLVE